MNKHLAVLALIFLLPCMSNAAGVDSDITSATQRVQGLLAENLNHALQIARTQDQLLANVIAPANIVTEEGRFASIDRIRRFRALTEQHVKHEHETRVRLEDAVRDLEAKDPRAQRVLKRMQALAAMDETYLQGVRADRNALADLLAQSLQFAEANKSAMNVTFGLLNFDSDELALDWQKQMRTLHLIALRMVERGKRYAVQRRTARETAPDGRDDGRI